MAVRRFGVGSERYELELCSDDGWLNLNRVHSLTFFADAEGRDFMFDVGVI